MKIHPMTRTAPQIRAEIRTSSLSQREKARRYNVSRTTRRIGQKQPVKVIYLGYAWNHADELPGTDG
jgi:hypothetical protein